MILCCGEALIDMIPTPTKNGPDGFVPHSGGAVFNTAIALGRLGISTGMLTGLSNDMFGTQLQNSLHASNVDTTNIVTSDRQTTMAFVTLKNGHASYLFYDENSAGRMLKPTDLPELDSSVKAMFFGGISLACEPGADAYAALAMKNASNRLVMMDPNIRIGFIEDETKYRTRLSNMIGVADIIKVSDEDLDWLSPDPNTHAEKAALLMQSGPSVVIVTKGADGATAYTRNFEVSTKSDRVEVVDTVGAGDTFNAGFLAKLAKLDLLDKTAIADITEKQLEAALQLGAKTAAITVSRAGANPPWAHELDSGF